MILKMFSVRDAKAEIFNPPFYTKTVGEAERNMTELANDPKSMVYKYPEDYDLWYLGTYDDSTGDIESLTPQHVTKVINLKRAEAQA